MATWDALKTAVLDHQFSSTKFDTYVGDKLNEAQSYVAAQVDFRALFTIQTISTTNGTASYALSSDFMRLYSLVETDTNNQVELQLIPFTDYDLLDATVTGRPTAYTIDRTNVKLYPTPDTTYAFQFRYYRTPTTMISGSTPEIPVTYHRLLERYCLAKCFEREHQLDLANYHWQKFQEELAKCRGEVQSDTDDRTQVDAVGGMWQDDDSSWPTARIP